SGTTTVPRRLTARREPSRRRSWTLVTGIPSRPDSSGRSMTPTSAGRTSSQCGTVLTRYTLVTGTRNDHHGRARRAVPPLFRGSEQNGSHEYSRRADAGAWLPPRRALPPRCRDRTGRDVHGPPGHGRAPGSSRRRQAARPGARRRPRLRRPLHARGPLGRPALGPRHRPGLRPGRRGRDAVPGHGARPWRHPPRTAGRTRSDAPVRGRGGPAPPPRRAARGPRCRARPPGHQARERAHLHQRRGHGHRRLPLPRTDLRVGHRRPIRPVLAGRPRLRDAHRGPALQRGQFGRRRLPAARHGRGRPLRPVRLRLGGPRPRRAASHASQPRGPLHGRRTDARRARRGGPDRAVPAYAVPAPRQSSWSRARAAAAVSGAGSESEFDAADRESGEALRRGDGPVPTRVHTRADLSPAPAAPQPDRGSAAGPYPPGEVEHAGRRAPVRPRRRLGLLWLGLVIAAATLLAVAGWWLGSGRFETVPSVQGMSVGQATEALGGLGFAAVTRDTFSDDVAPSALVGTDPDAGTRVPRGDTVAVLVSAGRPQVPEVGADRTVEAVSGLLRENS